MNRMMVVGVSAGVGKSTFSAQLGNILHMNVCHLDQLFWKPGWEESSVEEFAAAQRRFMDKNNQWIIEGNYSNTYDIRVCEADTIIYLELPLIICFYRVLKRWLTFKGKTRPDMAESCPEKIDWNFIKFICTTYRSRKNKMYQRLNDFQNKHPDNNIYILRGKKSIRTFLSNLQQETSE